MRNALVVILFAVINPALVIAQPPAWGYDASWSQLPITPALTAVRSALDHGLCEQAAVTFINNTTAQRIAIIPAGAPWPTDTPLMWYGKGTACDGKFQFVAADGPYLGGWAVQWDRDSWVDGPVPAGWPIGADGKHPTRWRIAPQGPVDSTIPVSPCPPECAPPPPPPAPVVTPDVAALQATLAVVQAKVDALAIFADSMADVRQLLNALAIATVDHDNRIKAIESKPTPLIPTACVAAINLGATHVPISCKLK